MAESKNYCYLVMTPDPNSTFGNVPDPDDKNKNFFFVKFGDGEFRDAYKTHNPAFVFKQNSLSSFARLPTVIGTGKTEERGIGKNLEWLYLKSHCKLQNTSEWYSIKLDPNGNGDLPTLIGSLTAMLNNFENYDWNNNGSQQQFEAAGRWIVDKCIIDPKP